MKKNLLTIIFCLVAFSTTKAQITMDCNAPYDTPESLVNLLVDGVPFSNVTFSGFDCSAGAFTSTNPADEILVESGLVMATNGLDDGPGGGAGVDEDLTLQLQMIGASNTNLNNLIILEFDFEPTSTEINFEYVFASNEYPNYTCSQYNDIFGFFLSGPGISGPFSNDAVNIALIPDPDNEGEYTDVPVIINTVNSGIASGSSGPCDEIDPNWQDYSVFFNNDNYQSPDVPYSGFTLPLTASYEVIPCETYHIKLAIADVADGALNSAVFLTENSFSSPLPVPDYSSSYAPWIGNDTTLVEGCFDGALSFSISEPASLDYIITYDLDGSAVDGVDFEPIGEVAVIETGQTSVTIPIVPIYDGIVEGDEDIVITAMVSDGCTSEERVFNFVIKDRQEMYLVMPGDTTFCPGDPPIFIDPYISGGIEPFTFEWMYNGALLTNQEQIVINDENIGYYMFEADGLCGSHVEGSFETSILEPEEPLAIFNSFEFKDMCMGDVLRTNVQLNGGIGDVSYQWYLNGVPYTSDTLNFDIATDIPYEYRLRLEAADECHNTVYEDINISVMDCFIPNVFSPNNDRENDFWYINFGETVENVRLDIYNRWGQLVYMNSHYEQCNGETGEYCWDGTDLFSKGECSEGTYYYKIEMLDGRKYSGTFNLFR